MYGTTEIHDCQGEWSAICVETGGTFNLYDGTIRDCTSGRDGGAIWNGGTVLIAGAAVPLIRRKSEQ